MPKPIKSDNRPLSSILSVAQAIDAFEPIERQAKSTPTSGLGIWEKLTSNLIIDMSKYNYRVNYGPRFFWLCGDFHFSTIEEAENHKDNYPTENLEIIPVQEIL